MNDMLKMTPDFSLDAAAALLKEHYGCVFQNSRTAISLNRGHLFR